MAAKSPGVPCGQVDEQALQQEALLPPARDRVHPPEYISPGARRATLTRRTAKWCHQGMNKTLAIVLAVIVIVGVWFAGTYNGLVSKREAVSSAWAQVQNVYQRRSDHRGARQGGLLHRG